MTQRVPHSPRRSVLLAAHTVGFVFSFIKIKKHKKTMIVLTYPYQNLIQLLLKPKHVTNERNIQKTGFVCSLPHQLMGSDDVHRILVRLEITAHRYAVNKTTTALEPNGIA